MEEGSSSSSEQCLLESILDGKEKPTNLSLALLQKITNDFSNERKIGQGGFGAVYKGVFGERIVAVKKIEKIDIYDKLFDREFNCLWVINHENVVRFLGFCSSTCKKAIETDGIPIFAEVRERLFCFEYVSGGSLDKRITDELRGLEWETRFEIITGICKGLCYLHKKTKIIHMDLKPANILLDGKNMVPKITDFGLSRPNTNSHTMAQPIGTLGYIAPEYRENSKTTTACDIYSLGAIIMELVTGGMEVPNKHYVLRRWRHRWKKPPTPLQYRQIIRCIEIAGRCREQKPEDRPSIEKIVVLLSESTNGHTGLEISTYMDDDMIGIEPLELHFNKEMSWSVKLTNKTKAYFAFKIESQSNQYTMGPEKGIVPPGSESLVRIEVGASQVTQNGDKFIVWSTKVSEGLTAEHITEHTFHEDAGKVVDEVDLLVVHEPTKVQQKFRSREDTNISAEEVPEAKKRKFQESASGKGKNKLGVSEKAEASCMDISSSAQGQYTDRCNFHPPENFSHSHATNMTYLVRDSDRAVDVTRGAMGSLLHKLGVLDKQFNLKTSVKKDAEELVKMQQVLRKVSDVQRDNLDDLAKHWASNVREMSYDLEDFVDGFLVHSEPDSNVSELTHEMCLEKDKSHQPIDDLIKHQISNQVKDEAKKCKEYKVENTVANATTKVDIESLQVSGIYEDQEQLVGIETPRNELIRLFQEGGDVSMKDFRIVSIVGLGGLGKTTLAKAVYNNLKAQYSHKTVVSVGQYPDVKKVLTNIIRKMNKDFSGANSDVKELIGELKKFLKDKRYFIVIDDIWDCEAWNVIKYAFPRNNHGSRVITTTRIERVALACCHPQRKYVYSMKPLGKEDSRILFLTRIFGPGKDCPDAQKHISIDILKKCGGMPLAINSIASLLAGQQRSTWDYVHKTLGAIVEENPEIGNVKQILDLSYIHLPDHLKTCLLYICKYQEDEEINKFDLLRQWVAEGFVQSKNGMLDAEDVAEQYFKALINMCMIQPGEIDYNDEVLSCRVHDIILELIRSKSVEENFVHVVDGLKEVTRVFGQIRRVSVHSNDKEDSGTLATIKGFVSQCSHVRSVCLYGVSPLVPYFLVFKYIRVLDLRATGSHDFTGISRLFLLRYLRIEGSNCRQKLPDQIGELQQLETLQLEGFSVYNYPSDIVSLPRLSHLICRTNGVVLPEGIGSLKSLHTLNGVDVYKSSVDSIEGLGELTNLRDLKIFLLGPKKKKAEEALHSSISRLSTSLRVLTLNGCSKLDGEIWTKPLFPTGSCIGELNLSECNFQSCPQWIGELHHLYSLTITVTEVADAVSKVAALPSLAFFCVRLVYRKAENGTVVISGSRGFQALKHLVFHCGKTSLTFELGALPKLQMLNVQIAGRVLPVGLEHLPAPSLKEISLSVGTDWKVKGAENWNHSEWQRYRLSSHYTAKLQEYNRKMITVLKKALKTHQPGAEIYISFEHGWNYDPTDRGVLDPEHHEEPGDEEYDEDAYDDEDFRQEDYCTSSEEADKGALQENGSQPSSQVRANTGQVELVIEAPEYSGTMSINTDVPPTSLHLAVGSERCTEDLESL